MTKYWAQEHEDHEVTIGVIALGPEGELVAEVSETISGGDTPLLELPYLPSEVETLQFFEQWQDPANIANYDIHLDCDEAVDLIANDDGRVWVDVSADYYFLEDLQWRQECEWVNVRDSVPLLLYKDWADGATDGDVVQLNIDGENPIAGPATVGGSDFVETIVYSGETVTLSEQFPATNQSAYTDTDLDCGDISDPVYSPGEGSGQLTILPEHTVDPPDSEATIVCRFTNARTHTVTLDKHWLNAPEGEQVTLWIQGEDEEVGVVATNGEEPEPAELTVLFGETVAVAEEFTLADNAHNYDIVLYCNAEIIAHESHPRDPATLFADLQVDQDLTCRFENRLKTVELTIDKQWESDRDGVTVTLAIEGSAAGDLETTATSPSGADDNTLAVRPGETVTLTEEFEDRAEAPRWFTSIGCADDAGSEITQPVAVDDREYQFTVPAGIDALTCTFTNSAEPATVELTKVVENDSGTGELVATDWELWVGEHQVATTLLAEADRPVGASSAASGQVKIPAGTYELFEAVADDGDPELYRPYGFAGVACVDGQGLEVELVDGTVTVVGGDSVVCTFVNDDADLTVTKVSLGDEEGFGWNDLDLSGGISAGDTVGFEVIGTNTGDMTLHDVVLTDPHITDDQHECGDLEPDESCVWGPLWLELSQEDVDARQVTNAAFGTSVEDDDDDDETVEYDPEPAMRADKTYTGCNPQVDCDDGVQVGDVVTWDITTTNTGPVTLVDVVVEDELTGNVDDLVLDCAAELAPGESCTVSVEYQTQLGDLVAGDTIPNIALVTAYPENETEALVAEPPAEAPIEPEPVLHIDKSVTPQVIHDPDPGVEVAYTFVVTNTGNIALNQIQVVDDTIIEVIGCEATELDPGESTTCTTGYAITAQDIASGQVHNVAYATGQVNTAFARAQSFETESWSDPVVSNTDDATVVFTEPATLVFTPTPPAPTPTPTPEPEQVLGEQVLATTGANSRKLAATALVVIMSGMSLVYGATRRRDPERIF